MPDASVPDATLTVEETVADRRFELRRGDERLGLIDVRPDDDGRVLAFVHTEIDARHRGRGLGAVLVRGALDAVRARGASVLPHCWFVRDFIAEHADYCDLVPADAHPRFRLPT